MDWWSLLVWYINTFSHFYVCLTSFMINHTLFLCFICLVLSLQLDFTSLGTLLLSYNYSHNKKDTLMSCKFSISFKVCYLGSFMWFNVPVPLLTFVAIMIPQNLISDNRRLLLNVNITFSNINLIWRLRLILSSPIMTWRYIYIYISLSKDN